MKTSALLLFLACALILLSGCPDLHPRFERRSPRLSPLPPHAGDSPVAFPAGWKSRPHHPGYVEVTDPVLARALLSAKPSKKPAQKKMTVIHQEHHPEWFWKFLRTRPVQPRSRTRCPYCSFPLDLGLPCLCQRLGRRPTALEREAWKRAWKSKGVLPADPRHPALKDQPQPRRR